MKIYYIDTSALVWRYLSGTLSSYIDAIIESSSDKTFTNEITILEWSSALGKTILRKEMSPENFAPNELALFTDIAQQKLRVIQPERVIERARDMIRLVAILKKRQLRTVDAIHLASAVELSNQLGRIVEFVTCDKRLARAADLKPFELNTKALYLQQGIGKSRRCNLFGAIFKK